MSVVFRTNKCNVCAGRGASEPSLAGCSAPLTSELQTLALRVTGQPRAQAKPALLPAPSLPCLPEPFCQRKQPPSFTQARAVLLGAGVQRCGGPGCWGGCPPAHRAGDGRCWASLGEFIVSCCWCFRDHSAYPPNSQMRANSLYRPLKPKILLIPSSNE